jgi:hypothetical protein
VSAVAGNILIDEDTGLFVLDGGNLVISSGHDAARQAVYSRLRFFKAEWFMDEDLGIPYWTEILGVKNPNIPAIRELFRQVIAGTPGIDSVISIDLSWTDTRKMTLSFKAKLYDETLLVTDGFAVVAP